MLLCKNNFFKKLLIFSTIFLVFSLFCNKVIYADASGKEQEAEISVAQVKVQQKKIISSLKKIEDCLNNQKVVNDATARQR